MTKATAEIFGQILECMANGEVRVANLVFHLPEGESAGVGQFIRASLTWEGDENWRAKTAEVFATAEPATEVQQEEPVRQVANSGLQTSTVAASNTGTQAQNTGSTKGFAGFGKRPTTTETPASTPAAAGGSRFGAAVVPLRPAPAAANAAPAKANPAPAASQPAKQQPAPVQQAAPAAPVSRFGSAVAKAAPGNGARPVAAAARPAQPARPAFDPMDDTDIPF